MDLWDRHSRRREWGSSGGPVVGACSAAPGAAERQMERMRGDREMKPGLCVLLLRLSKEPSVGDKG